jgi:sugar phosphate isomerase/epimerase
MFSFAISTWALHRRLTQDQLGLVSLPAEVAAHGFDAIELCHFHLPSNEPSYLSELKAALGESGIRLQSLLIDDGDLSDSVENARWESWISGQIEVAAALGAERARIIAGKQSFSEEGYALALASTRTLAAYAKSNGVRLTAENWFPLMDQPEAVNRLLDDLEGDLGLCGDFGNWPAPRKYTDLPKILARAETIHAKCEFVSGLEIDQNDYQQCLQIALDAGFSGTFVAVNGGSGDEWAAVQATHQAILQSPFGEPKA